MTGWNRAMIRSYHAVSFPWRYRAHQRYAKESRFPLSVLFYHRVAENYPNPWTMDHRTFADQIDWLAKRYELISLAEVQERIRANHNPRPALAITFDDGYAENSQFAIPYLVRRQIPVTYFVSVRNVLEGVAFEHDLQRNEPLPVDTIDSLRAMSHCGIEIGCHSRSHVDFSHPMSDEEVYDEVVTATNDLASELKTKIRYFAIPYGLSAQLDPRVFQMAHENGIEGVCSAFGGFNLCGDSSFHIQRFHGDPELTRMRNWLHWDPRQLRRSPKSVSIDSIPAHPAPDAANREVQAESPTAGLPT